MTFDDVLAQVLDLLQREGRVSYRALKRRFALDDDYLEDLKAELLKAKRLAIDEEGEVLVWAGNTALLPGVSSSRVPGMQAVVARTQPPVSYTPKYLAERILAEQAAMEARGTTDGER